MKKRFAATLLLATLTTFGGYASAAATVKGANGNSDNVATSTTTPMQMTARVTAVDNTAKTFAVIANNKNFVFSAAKLKTLPAAGDIVNITYTENPGGGTLESINLNALRSNIH